MVVSTKHESAPREHWVVFRHTCGNDLGAPEVEEAETQDADPHPGEPRTPTPKKDPIHSTHSAAGYEKAARKLLRKPTSRSPQILHCPLASGTHRWCAVAGVGVVLDLPESLIKTFPLVGLPVLVLALVIGE